MSKVLGLIDVDTCELGGHDIHPKYLRDWNGITACVYCVRDIHNEIDTYEEAEHERNTYFSIGNTCGAAAGIWSDGEAAERPSNPEHICAEPGPECTSTIGSARTDCAASTNAGTIHGDNGAASNLGAEYNAGTGYHARVAVAIFAIPGGRTSSDRCTVLAAYAGSGTPGRTAVDCRAYRSNADL